jgi:hypothetical protein
MINLLKMMTFLCGLFCAYGSTAWAMEQKENEDSERVALDQSALEKLISEFSCKGDQFAQSIVKLLNYLKLRELSNEEQIKGAPEKYSRDFLRFVTPRHISSDDDLEEFIVFLNSHNESNKGKDNFKDVWLLLVPNKFLEKYAEYEKWFLSTRRIKLVIQNLISLLASENSDENENDRQLKSKYLEQLQASSIWPQEFRKLFSSSDNRAQVDEFLRKNRTNSVLVIGCGAQTILQGMTCVCESNDGHKDQLTLDICPTMLPDIVGSINDIDNIWNLFGRESFDRVRNETNMGLSTLCTEAVYREIFRVLKQGGKLELLNFKKEDLDKFEAIGFEIDNSDKGFLHKPNRS